MLHRIHADGFVVAKLDFANASNRLHRDAMVQAVADKVPEIYKFCYLLYQQSSISQFSRLKLLSNAGSQRGDPFGPLLFCLTIHSLLIPTTSDLTICFMDDVTLDGYADTAARDVEMFRTKGVEMGLQLNVQKCELVSANSSHPIATSLEDFVQMEPNNQLLSFMRPTSPQQRHG